MKRPSRAAVRGFVTTLLVLALAVALVIAVSESSGRFTRFDMTAEGYYTLSEETEKLVGALNEDVEIILFAVKGSEDITLQGVLSRYEDLSPHIRLRTLDPAADPEAAARYAPNLRYGNSIVVVADERSRFVDYTELYVSDYSSYYQSGNPEDILNSFEAEKAITRAIDYVTNDALPILYVLSGHEESSLGESIQNRLISEGIRMEALELGDGIDIPADCSCILLNAPTYDISESEREKIASYLAAGGRLLLTTAYSGEALPQLTALTENFGAKLQEGLVVEQDRDHYVYGYYDCLVPNLESHEITADLVEGDAYVIVPGAQGILHEEKEDVCVTPLLTSSAAAYATADLSSVGKKEGDLSGPFTLGAAFEWGESRIVWYSTGFLLNETYTQNFGGANEELFLSSIRWLCGESPVPEIAGKSISADTLEVSSEASLLLGTLMCVLIPLVFIAAGAIILIRRRRA